MFGFVVCVSVFLHFGSIRWADYRCWSGHQRWSGQSTPARFGHWHCLHWHRAQGDPAIRAREAGREGRWDPLPQCTGRSSCWRWIGHGPGRWRHGREHGRWHWILHGRCRWIRHGPGRWHGHWIWRWQEHLHQDDGGRTRSKCQQITRSNRRRWATKLARWGKQWHKGLDQVHAIPRGSLHGTCGG